MREAAPTELAAREMGAEAAAVRAAATRDADVTLGLDVAVREPAATMDGRLVGTGRRPALAAAGVCALADTVAEGVGRVAVLVAPVPTAGVLAPGVEAAAVVADVLRARADATGVLGEPFLLARELAAADRAVLDAAETRPAADALTGERTPAVGLTGEEVRDVMLADVGGLDADAEERLLPTLAELVLLAAEGGAVGARLVLGAAVLAGVDDAPLRGLRRAAAAADGVAVAAGRDALAAGVGGGMGSSSTLCISSSGDRTWTWLERTKTP